MVSALKEISETPPRKRRKLVRVQVGGTPPSPSGYSFSQETIYTQASLPPLQRGHRFRDTPVSPKKKSEIQTAEPGLLTTLTLLREVGCTMAVMPNRSCTSGHPRGLRKEFLATPRGCLV